MKLSKSFIVALLAIGAYAQDEGVEFDETALIEAAEAGDAVEGDANPEDVEAEEDSPPGGCEGEDCPQYKKVCTTDEVSEEKSCQWCLVKSLFEPDGPDCEETYPW